MGVGGSSQASRAPRLPLTVSACFSSDQLLEIMLEEGQKSKRVKTKDLKL